MNDSQPKAKELRRKQDSLLVQRVRNNAPGAQNDFYMRFKVVAYKAASDYLKNRVDIEEIVQDAILRALGAISADAIEKPEEIGNFVITTAKGKARDLLEKQKAQKRGGGAFHRSISKPATETSQKISSPLLIPGLLDLSLITAEHERIIENHIDHISDPLLRTIIRLRLGGFQKKQIKELLSPSENKFESLYRYHSINHMAVLYQAILKDKLSQISQITENRLDDLELLFKSLTTDYKHFASDLNFSLGVINDVILGKLPQTNNTDVLHFKSQAKLFLFELLVNKAVLQGQGGAFGMSGEVFDLCDTAGNLEGKMRLKHAESIGYRIKKDYTKALTLLDESYDLAEKLKDKQKRKAYQNKILGEKGRILSRTGLHQKAIELLELSSYVLEESGAEASFVVKQTELADAHVQAGSLDKSAKMIQEISSKIPKNYVNLAVKLRRVEADLLFAIGDRENAFSSFRLAWGLSDKVVLRNQFQNLFELLEKHHIYPEGVLVEKEIERGRFVSALI